MSKPDEFAEARQRTHAEDVGVKAAEERRKLREGHDHCIGHACCICYLLGV